MSGDVIELESVVKRFGAVTALDRATLRVQRSEFVALLLRPIGFETLATEI